MQAADILKTVGLTGKEASVYLAILELGESTIKPIADLAGVKRTSIYNFIDNLVGLGLVSRLVRRGRNYYSAKPPARLLELQRERLQQVEQALPELEEAYQRSSQRPRMSYFEGAEEVKNIVLEESRCEKEVLYIWPGEDIMEMIGGVSFMSNVDRRRIEAGVKVRTIRFRRKDIKFATSGHGPKFLRELRFAPPFVNIRMGMGIYDTGKVSFFSSKTEGFGILVESEELTELMTTLYELLWKSSQPAKVGEG